jgi:hypothetical protein
LSDIKVAVVGAHKPLISIDLALRIMYIMLNYGLIGIRGVVAKAPGPSIEVKVPLSRSKVDVQVRPLMSRATARELDAGAHILGASSRQIDAGYDPVAADRRGFVRVLAFDSTDRCDTDASRFSSRVRMTVSLRNSVRALSKSFCRPSS